MAKYDELVRARQAREQQLIALREQAIDQFGQPLGPAFADYAYEGLMTEATSHQEHLVAFAEAVISTHESESHEEKVKALIALLKAIEARLAPVAKLSLDAHLHNSPIG
jgi:hypothetical protein